MQLQTNDTMFHNWKVNRVIGSGSFGTVYEIQREEFGRTYKAAAKVITIPDDSNNRFLIATEGMTAENTVYYYKSLVEDIIRECDVMERMKGDSHIVSFEDHYVEELDNGRRWIIYIRMELLKPLISYITDEDNFLKRDEIIQIGIDICKGLEVCEKFNVVHRDIKLENIFVSDTGKYKLGDFGISKVVEESELAISQKGTKLYMAPEMFRGDKYDATVDIYSLGLVLYRLLNNNRAPFMPAYPQRIRIQDKEIALQRRLAGEVLPNPCNADERLSEIVKKACCFMPRERYQTPTEMRQALEGLLKSSEGVYMVEGHTEATSKTLLVQDVKGRYSLKKGDANIIHNKRNIKEMVGLCGGAILVFIMLAMGIIGYKNVLRQNTTAECVFQEGILPVAQLDEVVADMTALGMEVAETELQQNWLIVPNILHVEESEAIKMLLEAGYEEQQILITYEYSDDVIAGCILYQSVESSTQVKKGTEISVIVSKGRKPVVTTNKQSNKKSEDSGTNVKWKTLD